MSIESIAKNQHQLTETAQWILDNCIIIDTETTGLGENDVVIELAAIRASDGQVLANSLIKPAAIPSAAALKINGISECEALEQGKSFDQAYNDFLSLTCDNEYLTAFNRAFDERLIRQTLFKMHITNWPWPQTYGPICIMEIANRAFAHHLEWDAEQAKFKRLSLAKCLEIAGIEFDGEPHRALTDAKSTLELVKYIANGGR